MERFFFKVKEGCFFMAALFRSGFYLVGQIFLNIDKNNDHTSFSGCTFLGTSISFFAHTREPNQSEYVSFSCSCFFLSFLMLVSLLPWLDFLGIFKGEHEEGGATTISTPFFLSFFVPALEMERGAESSSPWTTTKHNQTGNRGFQQGGFTISLALWAPETFSFVEQTKPHTHLRGWFFWLGG